MSHEEREIGDLAVWSLSTAKPGNGVEQLRDDSTDTYWQSDGPQPHLINIQFHKQSQGRRMWGAMSLPVGSSSSGDSICCSTHIATASIKGRGRRAFLRSARPTQGRVANRSRECLGSRLLAPLSDQGSIHANAPFTLGPQEYADTRNPDLHRLQVG